MKFAWHKQGIPRFLKRRFFAQAKVKQSHENGHWHFCWHPVSQSPTYRSDISQRRLWQLPPCPLVIALVPLKCSKRNVQYPHRGNYSEEKCLGALEMYSKNVQSPHRVPFTTSRKCLGALALSKNEPYRPVPTCSECWNISWSTWTTANGLVCNEPLISWNCFSQ